MGKRLAERKLLVHFFFLEKRKPVLKEKKRKEVRLPGRKEVKKERKWIGKGGKRKQMAKEKGIEIGRRSSFNALFLPKKAF